MFSLLGIIKFYCLFLVWLQVHFDEPSVITGVIVQGGTEENVSLGASDYDSRIDDFTLRYLYDGDWQYYKDADNTQKV